MMEQMRDRKTKEQFVQYLNENPDLRFFQAIRNFTMIYLNGRSNFICSSSEKHLFEDTFDWECDEMLEKTNKMLEKKGEL